MKGKFSPKVRALYEAVMELIGENVDIHDVKVSDITGRAGIGKGTAYEYFSNKEELISSALLYHIDMICRQMIDKVETIGDFREIFDYLLVCMDREISKRDCLIQFIQLLIDNGPISQLLQKKVKEAHPGICLPQAVIEQVLQVGIRQGVIREELPIFYMRVAIMSKLLTYALYLASEKKEVEKQEMHRLIYAGVLRELG